MNRRLLFIVNDVGFFMSHRLPIAKRALSEGFEVHIAAPHSKLEAQLNEVGLISHSIKMNRSGLNPFAEIVSFLSVIRLLFFLSPSVLHLVTIKPVLYGGIAARIVGVPSVVAAISGLGFAFIAKGLKAKFVRIMVGALYRLALRHSNIRIIFQNLDDQEIIRKFGALKDGVSCILPGSGVDLNEYQPSPERPGTPIVVMVSRLLIDKGVCEFVEAAGLVRSEISDVRFVLVGDIDSGNPTSVDPSLIEKWKSERFVEFWGYRSDIADILAKSCIVVLPSYREGLPKILIEASACGRPIVTTDAPGCRDAILPGESGLLVPVKNCHALARSISVLLSSPALRREMGCSARRLAESRFSVTQIVDEHILIYRQLVKSSNPMARRQFFKSLSLVFRKRST